MTPVVDITKLESALQSLLQGIAEAVATHNNSSLNYDGLEDDLRKVHSNLLRLSKQAYKALVTFGNEVELSVLIPTAKMEGDLDGDKLSIQVSESSRERLRNVGRSIWMTVRSHPVVFSDAKLHQDMRAYSGGYIRAIAARLILVNGIQTKGSQVPLLVDAMDEGGQKFGQPSNMSVMVFSLDELEFGLKCFSRAGRALLHGSKSTPDGADVDSCIAAYTSLSLATRCWRVISGGMDGLDKDRLELSFEEVFDAASLLPDAAAMIFSHPQSQSMNDSKDHLSSVVGNANHVVRLLEDVMEYIPKQENQYSVSTTQRHLPTLARTAFQHGSRFGRSGEYLRCKECLHVSLSATDVALAAIRSSSLASSEALRVQEQEMFVISKQSFYVLAHACQATGKFVEAFKCLDRIEVYINDQRKREDDLYNAIINNLTSGKNKENVTGLSNSDLRSRDKQEVHTRAQTARARSKWIEYNERANLAFSRNQIMHNQCLNLSDDDEVLTLENKMDENIKSLVEISGKIAGDNRSIQEQRSSSEEEGTFETSTFNKILQSCRQTRVRRLTRNAIEANKDARSLTNPYDFVLKAFESSQAFKLISEIDHLNAVITACHEVRQKGNATHEVLDSVGIQSLDMVGVEVAQEVMSSLERVHINNTSRSSEGILPDSVVSPIDTSIFGRESVTFRQISEMAKTHLVRALALYRTLPTAHGVTAQYADFLLQLIKFTNIEEKDDNSTAEILAIKAYALTSSGSLVSGLDAARTAWYTASKSIDADNIPESSSCLMHNIFVLFHCSLHLECTPKKDRGILNDSCAGFFVELDETINQLCCKDLLRIFPALAQSCLTFIENCDVENDSGVNRADFILLGVQERWIGALVHQYSGSIVNMSLSERNHAVHVSLFSILRAFLTKFEKCVITKSTSSVPIKCMFELKSLNKILTSVLLLICEAREIKQQDDSKSCVDMDELNPNKLIWDIPFLQEYFGTHTDCVWLAEQVWNLSIFLMNTSVTESDSKLKELASCFFANAHDFALLSEEVYGACISKGHVDVDKEETNKDALGEDVWIEFGKDCKDKCFELSSEFSAHALLLSVANAVDFLNDSLEDGPESSEEYPHHGVVLTDLLQSRIIHRIRQCNLEFQSVNEVSNNNINKNCIEGVLAWLSIRLLIHTGNDKECVRSLVDGGILKILVQSSPASLDEATPEDRSKESLNNNISSIASQLYLCAKWSQAKKMISSCKLLLDSLGKLLVQSRIYRIEVQQQKVTNNQPFYISIGDIRKKLVQLSSSVDDTIQIMEEVSQEVTLASNRSGNIRALYSQECINWFAVESYNQGINLLFLGEVTNAERMLATALNFLPSCGREVECHAAEMRLAYHRAVERKNDLSASLSIG